MEINVDELLVVAREAALSAARILQRGNRRFKTLEDGGKDLKSTADFASNECLLNALIPTGIPIISEETPFDAGALDVDRLGLTWIIDPLDGTVNFMRGLPAYCVSIALWNGRHPVLGVISIPEEGATIEGVVGAGAWIRSVSDGSNQPIRVSSVDEINQSMLCTGFPTGRSYSSESLQAFIENVQQFKKVRMVGSAAYMLSLVARGAAEVYYEDEIWLWDVAAGLAIVQGAGGAIQCGPWSSQLKSKVVATNGRVTVDS